MSTSENKERYISQRKYKRESSSDSESNSSKGSRRSSSSRTDEDGGRSTPEDKGNGHQKDISSSKKRTYDKERHSNHEKSRHVSSSRDGGSSSKRHDYRNDRERHRGSRTGRYNSSSDESDSHNRQRRRTRSRSREPKSKEREPKRPNAVSIQRSGDRRLFPQTAEDRSSPVASTNAPENEVASWREGGPLPPPVFIGNQGVAPPPPNISGRVAPQPMVAKGHKTIDKPIPSSDPSPAQESNRSFVPPYLVMPPHPNSNASNQSTLAAPIALGGRPIVPPPHKPPPGAPPALGHRPPPPPVRPPVQNLSSKISSHDKPEEISNEKIVNFHNAPKAPKKLPEAKPEIKRPPPKVQTGAAKNIAIKLGPASKLKPIGLTQKIAPSVASVFGADSDSDEEIPQEAKMRMRNVGRETPTSSGPNSFGKTRQGFTDTKKLYEKNMHKPLFDED